MAETGGRRPPTRNRSAARLHSRRKAWVNRLIRGEISESMLKQFEHREQMEAEATRLLGKANALYIQGPTTFQEAVQHLRRSIALVPRQEAFTLLAAIYDTKGDVQSRRKATELLMLAAHMRKTEAEVWKEVHGRYMEQGHIDEACYCLKRAAAALARADPDAAARLLRTKADLHLTHGHHRSKAIAALKALLPLRGADRGLREDSLLMLAELYHKAEQSRKATALLEQELEEYDPAGHAFPTRVALMLLEIQMERGFFRDTLQLISDTITRVFRCALTDLPPEFLSKAIICELYLDRREEADRLAQFMARKWPMGPAVPYAEACYDVAKAYCDVGEYDVAYRTFLLLLEHETFAQPNLRYQLGRCCQQLDQVSTAIVHFDSVLEETPEHVPGRIALSKALRDIDPYRAAAVLQDYPEEKVSLCDAVLMAVERSRLLNYLGRHAEVHAAALPVLQGILRAPPPPTLASSRTARTEVSMRSTMSRLVSSQFVLSRFDVLPESALGRPDDVLSQSALSTASAAATFTPRPALDANPTLFGRKARGGPGSRKRRHDDAFQAGDTESQATQQTSLADLDGFSDGDSAGGDSASDAGASSAVDSDGLTDMEADAPDFSTVTLAPEYLIEVNRSRWHWGTVKSVLPEDPLLEWLTMVLHAMAEAQQYEVAVQFLRDLLASITNSDRFKDRQGKVGLQLRRQLAGFHFLQGQFNDAYDVVRSILLGNKDSAALWNVFAHILHKTEHMRHSHAIMHRLLKASPHIFPILIFVAHFHLCGGSFAVSMRFYMEAFRRCPDDALVLLCVAVASLGRSLSRKNPNRHALVAHAFAFFERYSRARAADHEQEVQYNLGRAYHHLGLAHLAVPHYWRVLDLVGTRADEGLQREAAFNLHHIYRASGNNVLAAQVLREHCFV